SVVVRRSPGAKPAIAGAGLILTQKAPTRNPFGRGSEKDGRSTWAFRAKPIRAPGAGLTMTPVPGVGLATALWSTTPVPVMTVPVVECSDRPGDPRVRFSEAGSGREAGAARRAGCGSPYPVRQRTEGYPVRQPTRLPT